MASSGIHIVGYQPVRVTQNAEIARGEKAQAIAIMAWRLERRK